MAAAAIPHAALTPTRAGHVAGRRTCTNPARARLLCRPDPAEARTWPQRRPTSSSADVSKLPARISIRVPEYSLSLSRPFCLSQCGLSHRCGRESDPCRISACADCIDCPVVCAQIRLLWRATGRWAEPADSATVGCPFGGEKPLTWDSQDASPALTAETGCWPGMCGRRRGRRSGCLSRTGFGMRTRRRSHRGW
jgi:hypothetical protein